MLCCADNKNLASFSKDFFVLKDFFCENTAHFSLATDHHEKSPSIIFLLREQIRRPLTVEVFNLL